MHRIAWELRPPALDDLGLAPALQRYIGGCSSRCGISVDFCECTPESERLPAGIETVLYRIAQEALTNVCRHSKAHRASVLLDRHPRWVSLIVEDDGQGFDTAQLPAGPNANGNMGLAGMRERGALAGGTLQIESVLNAGTTLYIRIPLAQEPAAAERTKPDEVFADSRSG